MSSLASTSLQEIVRALVAGNGSVTDQVESFIFNTSVGQRLLNPFYLSMCAAFGAVLVAALIGNLLVLYAIVSSWGKRKTHRCLYLNLIACDLLVAVVILPATCYNQLDNRWRFGGSVGCAARQALSVCLMCGSVHTATALSWLRSLAARRAYRPPRPRTEWLLVGAIWLMAIALSCPAAAVSEVYELYQKLSDYLNWRLDRPISWPVCRENWDKLGRMSKFWYGFAILQLACVLPLVSLGVAYFRICRAIYRSNRVLNAHKRCEGVISITYHSPDNTVLSLRPHFSLASTCSAMNRRKRATNSRRMFLLGVGLVLIFAVTWLPMQVAQLCKAYWGEELNQPDFHRMLTLFHLLALTNCMVNPLYLLATHAWYRKRVQRLLVRLQRPCCHVSWHCDKQLRLQVAIRRRAALNSDAH